MKSPICELLDIEFPLIAFTHCRDVVCEVSKAGGFGVLGAAGYGPEQLEIELAWIDEHIDGKPYGVDLIVPTSMVNQDESASPDELAAMVPDEHKAFAAGVLARHNIDTADVYERRGGGNGGFLGKKGAANILDVAFNHPIRMIVNALGVPPQYMLELGKERGVPVGALVGAKHHAVKQAEAGVDILIVSGTEAGGHCGEVSTMVLVPEVVEAVKDIPGVCILAAGGIVAGAEAVADGGRDGDGCTRGLDGFSLADHGRVRSLANSQGKNARSCLQPDGAIEKPDREVFAPGPVTLDGCLGERRSAVAAADAAPVPDC